ncbi:PREDICTED: uncharacterized protein LOC104803712 [Tarenaya hassleriana]|uniref:uncharacterized protein LOC104803712 n=1 Tax=Tarenaya hassleriana TaxID=28532 RepID=UPI00053C11EC|nr:PREDICTED: uncharacterized protein LOC104803712 [Tarenaya hassleriana]
MVRKEDVDFYCSFSRKELQGLCKKYNLPANRSTADMAESLASHFETKSLSSGAFGVGRIQGAASGAPAKGKMDAEKDYNGSKLEMIGGDHSQTTVAGGTGFTPGHKAHYQDVHGALIESAYIPQFTKNLKKGPKANSRKDFLQRTECRLENQTGEVNTGECPQETSFPGCSTFSSSSSFEFHVSSEKGINLSVDLNFNPSDWITSMRNEVCIWNSMRSKKSRSSDQDTDDLTESEKQKNQSPHPGLAQDLCSSHTVKEAFASPLMKDNGQIPSDHQSSGEGSLTPFVIEPCSRKRDALDKYKKEERHNLFIPESSALGQIVSCAESCSKSYCVVSLDLDRVNSPGRNLASDSGTISTECPITLDTQENLTGDLPNKSSESPSPGSPQKVGNSRSGTPISPGIDGSETSSSEAKPYRLNPSCSPCKNSRSPDLSESKLIKDAESKGYSKLIFQYNAGKNCLASNVVEKEKSETISGQERSGLLV